MGESLKSKIPYSWLSLQGIILLQTIGGTRSVFSAYSFLVKQQLHISQVQVNYLNVALELGRVMGWLSSAAAEHIRKWIILFIGLIFGLVGYGVQYLYMIDKIPYLSFWCVFLLNVLAGNSICWINTYCTSVATRNFNSSQTIIEITSSYARLSGRIYTSLAKGVKGSEGIQGRKASENPATYLLLNSLVPIVVGLPVAVLIMLSPQLMERQKSDNIPVVFMIGILTGSYSVIEIVAQPFINMSPKLRMVILALVINLPLAVPLLMSTNKFLFEKRHTQVIPEDSILELDIGKEERENDEGVVDKIGDSEKGITVTLENDNDIGDLQMSMNFSLYFCLNICGSTLGMVYLNNLGRISESRGDCKTSSLLAISSMFGFFGRLFFVIFAWFTRERRILSGPASILLMMILMPISFFLLINDGKMVLYICTGILGTCSGAITAITSHTTSELFGSKNSIIKSSILDANIPLGSLLFGYLADINYVAEGGVRHGICIGVHCYRKTFIIWGSICSFGTLLSLVLYLRTRKLYHRI